MATTKEYDYEDMVDEVVKILTDNLSTYINEINAEKPDVFQIDMPKEIYFGMRRVDPEPEVGKSVVVIYPSNVEGDNYNPGTTDEDFSIDTMIAYWSAKAEEAERKIIRYVRAIRRTLDIHSLFKDLTPEAENIGDSVTSVVEFGMLDFVGDTYFKSAIVRLKIRNVWCYSD